MTRPRPRIPAPAPIERASRCAWREASRAKLDPGEQGALAALSRWIEEPDRPYAILHGRHPSRRAVVAAHLVRAQQEGTAYAAHLVPIGPDLKLERDILALLTSRLLAGCGGGPPRWLRMRIAKEHLRVGPTDDDPSLLLAITDVEEAEPLVSWPGLFAAVGPRVKVLATVEGDDAAAHAWLQRLGFDPARTRIHPLPVRPWPAPGDPTKLLATTGAASAELLGLLSVAYGRLREDEIATALGAPIESALAGIEPLVTAIEGTYAFRSNAARREVEERLDRDARDASIRRLLSLPPDEYPCAYARAHLEQAAAPLQAFAALVTEEHLARWMARPEAYLGFVADLERVRRHAVEALASGHEAAALAVRAALVEASVNSCARREDHDAPVGVELIDREKRIADERDQARALIALGAAMTAGPARAEVLAWAEDATRRIPEADFRGDAFLSLAEIVGGEARYAFAREALAAFRTTENAEDRAHQMLFMAKELPPEEGITVAREAFRSLRDGAGDPGRAEIFVSDFPRAVAEALWPDAEALPAPARAQVLAALARALGDPERVRTAFAALEQHPDPYNLDQHWRVTQLVPFLDASEARRAAALAPQFGERAAELVEELIPRLIALGDPAEDLLEALPEASRVRALARSLPFAAEPARLRARIDEVVRKAEPLERYGLFFDVGPWFAATGDSDAMLAWIATLSDAHHQVALGFLARHDPAHAPELTRRALSLALRLGAGEPDRLLELLPLARHFPAEGAIAAIGLLLDALAGDYRDAALAGDGVSLVKLAPLIAAIAGDDGLSGAAREVVQVAAWFP
ncbi:hypothetical protein predicted by Glimmer/Critica [Sorangium cellulosum So ce56]|uniref:Uncharacterized protein n=1 Tax=Sorangium cellulosum (strain So ce56) TaxID=448385 RepID=A9GD19_SORC5|nr:hypothetical protein [Sorangium cellulosum]CAN99299.1 hypothetical protein predicted by Glimmer/Critica [Sorangium cellulosum So ce56]